MKKISFWMLAAILTICATGVLTSCTEDDDNNDVVSATDPFPYPEEYLANKDNSVKPGDSFFDYCNGTWLASTPISSDPSKSFGGLYDALTMMDERVEQLKSSVPDLTRFFSLMEQIHDKPEASRAYIDAQKAKIQKPQTKEEAFRTIGKMYVEGVNVLGMTFSIKWDKDQLKAVLKPGGSVSMDDSEMEHHQTKLLQTRAASKTTVPALLAEGMGFDPSLMVTDNEDMYIWEEYWDGLTVDELYGMMQDGWKRYKPFVSAPEMAGDGNDNMPSEGQSTMEMLRAQARAALGYTISYHFQQKFVPQSLKDKYLGITKHTFQIKDL